MKWHWSKLIFLFYTGWHQLSNVWQRKLFPVSVHGSHQMTHIRSNGLKLIPTRKLKSDPIPRGSPRFSVFHHVNSPSLKGFNHHVKTKGKTFEDTSSLDYSIERTNPHQNKTQTWHHEFDDACSTYAGSAGTEFFCFFVGGSYLLSIFVVVVVFVVVVGRPGKELASFFWSEMVGWGRMLLGGNLLSIVLASEYMKNHSKDGMNEHLFFF